MCAATRDVRFGSKQTFAPQKDMSALPPKADMCSALADVRFVPIADIAPLFDHLTGSLPAAWATITGPAVP